MTKFFLILPKKKNSTKFLIDFMYKERKKRKTDNKKDCQHKMFLEKFPKKITNVQRLTSGN